jgi:electron transfer flavoprotein beta subunit
MNIIVLIKQVPLSSDIGIDEETGVILRESGSTKMNPYDLYALETALRIREKAGGKITVLTMGPPQAEQVVREAYMMGADYGYLLTDRAFAGSDVLATSFALSQALTHIGIGDLIICGKQTTDGDTAQVGVECSEFLGIPCITNVKRIIDIQPDAVTIESDMGMTIEHARITYPCLIAVDKDIYQPRLPSYRKKKATALLPVEKITLKDLKDQNTTRYGLTGSPTQVIKIFPPSRTSTHEIWEGEHLGRRLFALLRDEKHLQENA